MSQLEEFEQTYLDKFDDLAELSDSSVDSEGDLLRRGNIPYDKWYEKELHDAYDIDGKKVVIRGMGDNIDKFLLSKNKNELKRRIYDVGNDNIKRINDRDLSIINRIRKGKCATKMYDFKIPETHVFDITTSGIRPKSSFTISKCDYKKILKNVVAIKNGWIKVNKYGEIIDKNNNNIKKRMDPYRSNNNKYYDVWSKTNINIQSRQILNAPKSRKPTTYESYNPPNEYLSDKNGIKYQCLRVVPQYDRFIHQRFERCLDLYLLPRKVRKKSIINSAHLLPKLDSVSDLRPFPEILSREYMGHACSVLCIDINTSGEWLVSGSDDGTVRIFEIDSGRQYYCHSFGINNRIEYVQFNPCNNKQSLLTVVCKHRCFIIPISFIQSVSNHQKYVIQPIKKIKSNANPNLNIPKLNLKETLSLFKQNLFQELSHWPLLIKKMKNEMNWSISDTLQEIAQQIEENNNNNQKNNVNNNNEMNEDKEETEKIENNTNDISMAARWSFLTFHNNKKNTIIGNYELINNNVICISFLNYLNGIKWHNRGEYFCTWSSGAGGGNKRASLMIHRLNRFESVMPFSKSIGDISDIEWHPRKALIYIACKQSIRCFNLAKCKLQEKYAVTTSWISRISLHTSGLNMIVGGMDGHVCWYDMDLSHSPYKTFNYHCSGKGSHCVRNVIFHHSNKYNHLWASCGDDGKIYIFYCKMFRNKFADPILLPLKILQIKKHRFMDIKWHKTQPWIFAACSDGITRLYTAL